MKRRNIAAGMILTPLVGLGVPAHATEWPIQPVKMIVPFPPGGAADGSARILSEVMGRSIGKPIVVDNRAGAGGAIGIQAAMQSNDGHTLLMGSTSMTILPALRADLRFDIERDLQPVGMVSAQPLVVCVASASPLKSLEDLLTQAKSSALSCGNSGVGTLSHLTAELFNMKMQTKLMSIPYKGESALIPDIVGGTTDLAFINLPSALPLLKSGRLRALAVTSNQSLEAVPSARTLKSVGGDELVVEGWAALFAAKALPASGVQQLEKSLRSALNERAVRASLSALGVEPRPGSQNELQAFVRREIGRWADVIRSRKIKPE